MTETAAKAQPIAHVTELVKIESSMRPLDLTRLGELLNHELPLNYVMARMEREEGIFYLVTIEDEAEPMEFLAIPFGTVIGGHIVAMSHSDTLYNENHSVVGHFHEILNAGTGRIFLVRIFKKHPRAI